LGPVIGSVKGATAKLRGVSPALRGDRLAHLEIQITKLEASQQQICSSLEQIVLASLSERNIQRRLDQMEERLASELRTGLAAEIAVQHAAMDRLLSLMEQVICSSNTDRHI
jgi:hypothetical protein